MRLTTLDKVVRETLSERGYTLHRYMEFMVYAISALRELNFDTLQNVKSIRLLVNDYNAAKLPIDFVDVVRVGTEAGQYITPWSKEGSFNRMNKFDESGKKIEYPEASMASIVVPSAGYGHWNGVNINVHGEHLGRQFNGTPSVRNSFLVIRERDEIQFDRTVDGSTIVMDYITDGITVDATNAVHPYAIATIKSYILFKLACKDTRKYGLSDRRDYENAYYNELRKLRARMNPLTIQDIGRSLDKWYSPAIKH